ncbi:MAG TPA: hypothetical protein VMW23_03750 [Sedimentisphaerales bacterium]|nr:hypothetical protein [Sedimentisphaerales bacterium]
MSIVFHCEYCGKKIEAKDQDGSKWGKCPACHNRVYVPAMNSDEELKLAPLDEQDQKKQRELMLETRMLDDYILQQQDLPASESSPENATPNPLTDSDELTKHIIAYLRQMAGGDLEQARMTADAIIPHGQKAVEVLDKIALSEILEPELADVPPQVLAGLIRTLRTKLT